MKKNIKIKKPEGGVLTNSSGTALPNSINQTGGNSGAAVVDPYSFSVQHGVTTLTPLQWKKLDAGQQQVIWRQAFDKAGFINTSEGNYLATKEQANMFSDGGQIFSQVSGAISPIVNMIPGVGPIINAGLSLANMGINMNQKEATVERAKEVLPMNQGIYGYKKGGNLAGRKKYFKGYEAEGEEIVLGNADINQTDKSSVGGIIKGASHKNGGVDGVGGEYIISDRWGVDGSYKEDNPNSLANAAAPIMKSIAKLEKRKGDNVDRLTLGLLKQKIGQFKQLNDKFLEQEQQGIMAGGGPVIIPGTTYIPRDGSRTKIPGTNTNEHTINISDERGSFIIPTVWTNKDGTTKQYSNEEAIARFRKTGEHMGAFSNDNDASRGAEFREFMNNELTLAKGGKLKYYAGGPNLVPNSYTGEGYNLRKIEYADPYSFTGGADFYKSPDGNWDYEIMGKYAKNFAMGNNTGDTAYKLPDELEREAAYKNGINQNLADDYDNPTIEPVTSNANTRFSSHTGVNNGVTGAGGVQPRVAAVGRGNQIVPPINNDKLGGLTGLDYAGMGISALSSGLQIANTMKEYKRNKIENPNTNYFANFGENAENTYRDSLKMLDANKMATARDINESAYPILTTQQGNSINVDRAIKANIYTQKNKSIANSNLAYDTTKAQGMQGLSQLQANNENMRLQGEQFKNESNRQDVAQYFQNLGVNMGNAAELAMQAVGIANKAKSQSQALQMLKSSFPNYTIEQINGMLQVIYKK